MCLENSPTRKSDQSLQCLIDEDNEPHLNNLTYYKIKILHRQNRLRERNTGSLVIHITIHTLTSLYI